MIELNQVTKTFYNFTAIRQLTAVIRDGMIFGLVGSNGAGKSTMLRLMAGILRPDEGTVTHDGDIIFEQPEVKQNICFLSDTISFFPNATSASMCHYYSLMYPAFDTEAFHGLAAKFKIPMQKKLQTFSKGQKKQVSILLGICTGTKYLLCDETFDGLDPVMRQAVKSLFASELLKRDFTPVVASHNLRELEDICDCVGLIHEGKLLFTKDLDQMKCNINKIHCVISDPSKEEHLLRSLSVLQYEKSGSLLTITARGPREEILKCAMGHDPVFAEVLPLSLEEIFISETEAAGYDIKNLIQ